MKLEVQKRCLLGAVLVFYVNFVHAQFAKGVVKNNVFTQYRNRTSGGSSDHLNENQSATQFGYFTSKLNPTMVSTIEGLKKIELFNE